jgi:hypothetical protein
MFSYIADLFAMAVCCAKPPYATGHVGHEIKKSDGISEFQAENGQGLPPADWI